MLKGYRTLEKGISNTNKRTDALVWCVHIRGIKIKPIGVFCTCGWTPLSIKNNIFIKWILSPSYEERNLFCGCPIQKIFDTQIPFNFRREKISDFNVLNIPNRGILWAWIVWTCLLYTSPSPRDA